MLWDCRNTTNLIWVGLFRNLMQPKSTTALLIVCCRYSTWKGVKRNYKISPTVLPLCQRVPLAQVINTVTLSVLLELGWIIRKPKKLYLINIILLKRKKKKKHKTERKMVRSNLRLVSLFSYVKAANVVL